MAGQLNSFVSPEGQKQLDQVIASLETMQKQILDLNKQQINLEIKTANSGSVADVVKNTQALTKAQNDLTTEVKEYKKVADSIIPLQAKLEALDTDAAKAAAALKVQLQETNRALREEAQATNTAVQARKAAADARRQESQEARNLRALQEAERRETIAVQKAVEAAERRAAADARRQEAAAQRELNNEQKKENTNAIISGINGIWSAIRRVAYILPGLGIAGIFGLIFAGVAKAAEALGIFGDKIEDAQNKMRSLKDITKSYNESINELNRTEGERAAEQTARMNVLVTLAKDESQAQYTRNRAVKELQEQYPTYFGNLSKEAILHGDVTEAINKTTQALFAKAAAEAAMDKFTQASKTDYELKLKQEDALDKAAKAQIRYNNAKSDESARDRGPEATRFDGSNVQRALNALNDIRGALTDITTQRNKVQADQAKFLKDAQESAIKAGETLFGKQTEHAKKVHDFTNDMLKSEQDFTKQYYDELAKRLEASAQTQKLIADNQQLGLKERLNAFMQYEKLHLDAQETALNGEFIQTLQALDKIEKIEQKSATKRTNQEKKLLLEKSALMQKLVAIDAQAELLRVQNAGETQKGIKTIYDQEVKDAIDGLTEIKDINADAQAKALMANQQAYMDGNINFRKYKQEEVRINHEYNQELYTAEIEYLQREKELLQERRADTISIDKQITAIKKQQYDEDFKNFDQVQQKKEALRKKELDGLRQLGQAAIEFAKTIIYGNYQKQIDALQAKNDQIEKNKQLELDAIDASNKSDEEKTKLKLQLDAQVAKQEEDNTRRINEIKRKQAVADKAASIARIVEQTAIAVITGLAEGGPVLAAIYAALGAVQLATVLAQPLPQYWKGTDNAPEGLAWVGERGSELKIERDGKMSLTPATATLDYLTAGTKIIPAEQTNEILRSLAFTQLMTPQERVYTNDDVVDALSTQTKSIVQELRKQNRKQADNKLNWELFKQVKGNGIR